MMRGNPKQSVYCSLETNVLLCLKVENYIYYIYNIYYTVYSTFSAH